MIDHFRKMAFWFAVALTAALLMPAHAADGAPKQRAIVLTRVSATHGWQDTGFKVKAGDIYTVSYLSGGWTVDRRLFPKAGASGYTPAVDGKIYQGCKLNDHTPYGTLYAREGTADSTAPVPVAQGQILHAAGAGSVYLRINDNDHCLGDNAGSITVKLSEGISDTALTDPFHYATGRSRAPYEVIQGYQNTPSQKDCVVGRGPDHCQNQLFAVDLEPAEGVAVSLNVYSPAPGTVTWQDARSGCLGIDLADHRNLTVCHMSSFSTRIGASVQREQVLGVRRTAWIHLSIDNRTGGRPYLPVPLTASASGQDHTLDGSSLVPGLEDGSSSVNSVQWAGRTYPVGYEEWLGTQGP